MQREEKGRFSSRAALGEVGSLPSSGMRLQSSQEMKIQNQSVTIRVNATPQPQGLSLPPQAQPCPGEGRAGEQVRITCWLLGWLRDMENPGLG